MFEGMNTLREAARDGEISAVFASSKRVASLILAFLHTEELRRELPANNDGAVVVAALMLSLGAAEGMTDIVGAAESKYFSKLPDQSRLFTIGFQWGKSIRSNNTKGECDG